MVQRLKNLGTFLLMTALLYCFSNVFLGSVGCFCEKSALFCTVPCTYEKKAVPLQRIFKNYSLMEESTFEPTQEWNDNFEDVLTDLHNTFSSMDALLYDLTMMVSKDPDDEQTKEALEYVKKMMKDYYQFFDWKGLGWVTLNDPCVKGIVD